MGQRVAGAAAERGSRTERVEEVRRQEKPRTLESSTGTRYRSVALAKTYLRAHPYFTSTSTVPLRSSPPLLPARPNINLHLHMHDQERRRLLPEYPAYAFRSS